MLLGAFFVHSARFSCRMCLFFNIYRRTGISSCHYWLQLKEKRMDSCGVSLGLSLDVLIYNKMRLTLTIMIEFNILGLEVHVYIHG